MSFVFCSPDERVLVHARDGRVLKKLNGSSMYETMNANNVARAENQSNHGNKPKGAVGASAEPAVPAHVAEIAALRAQISVLQAQNGSLQKYKIAVEAYKAAKALLDECDA